MAVMEISHALYSRPGMVLFHPLATSAYTACPSSPWKLSKNLFHYALRNGYMCCWIRKEEDPGSRRIHWLLTLYRLLLALRAASRMCLLCLDPLSMFPYYCLGLQSLIVIYSVCSIDVQLQEHHRPYSSVFLPIIWFIYSAVPPMDYWIVVQRNYILFVCDYYSESNNKRQRMIEHNEVMSVDVATSVKKQSNQLEGGNSYEKQYHQRIRVLSHWLSRDHFHWKSLIDFFFFFGPVSRSHCCRKR